MTEPLYKLHYFQFYGRAEAIRMMLEHANVPYENLEFSFAEWPEKKPLMPKGQVPVLELPDGTMMPESYAIARYIARVHGYYPDDPRAGYEVDSLVDGFDDVLGSHTCHISSKG